MRTVLAALSLTASSALFTPTDEARAHQLSETLGIDIAVTRTIIQETLLELHGVGVELLPDSREAAPERSLLAPVDKAPWSFDCSNGPELWGSITAAGAAAYPTCNGKAQSPINIQAATAGFGGLTTKTNSVDSFVALKAAAFSVDQYHGSPVYECRAKGTCGSITWNKVVYNLVNVTFAGTFKSQTHPNLPI